jgi:uncharacterized ion transporter superfamily protein YfcC
VESAATAAVEVAVDAEETCAATLVIGISVLGDADGVALLVDDTSVTEVMLEEGESVDVALSSVMLDTLVVLLVDVMDVLLSSRTELDVSKPTNVKL